jgi:flagellar motor switch protein FliN/FliY
MMSDGMLSQDEIDALLRGAIDTDDNNDGAAQNLEAEEYLSLMEKDTLGEIGNISFGSSATALSTLLNQKVEITTPSVSAILKSKLGDEFKHPYVAIQVSYTEGFSGVNLLVIEQKDAAIIADLMLGGDGRITSELLGEIQLSAVQEAMNQMMGSAATSMSTIFNKRVDISPPSIDVLDLRQGDGTDKIPNDDMLVKISFRLKIGELIDSNIMQLLPIEFAKRLAGELLNPIADNQLSVGGGQNMNESANASTQTENPRFQEEQVQKQSNGVNNIQEKTGANIPMQNASYPVEPPRMNHQTIPSQEEFRRNSGSQHLGSGYGVVEGTPPVIQPAAFSNFESYPLQETEARNLEMLLDIPLQVTVELGRTKRTVKEILSLTQGSIIELDKLAGEPVDIYVNNRLIAKGEVVVIDENFGVRVTDIISKSDRIHQLK